MRWRGSGKMRSGECDLYYSGEEKSGSNGVSVMIGSKLKGTVLKVECINSRIMMIRMKGNDKIYL